MVQFRDVVRMLFAAGVVLAPVFSPTGTVLAQGQRPQDADYQPRLIQPPMRVGVGVVPPRPVPPPPPAVAAKPGGALEKMGGVWIEGLTKSPSRICSTSPAT